MLVHIKAHIHTWTFTFMFSYPALFHPIMESPSSSPVGFSRTQLPRLILPLYFAHAASVPNYHTSVGSVSVTLSPMVSVPQFWGILDKILSSSRVVPSVIQGLGRFTFGQPSPKPN